MKLKNTTHASILSVICVHGHTKMTKQTGPAPVSMGRKSPSGTTIDYEGDSNSSSIWGCVLHRAEKPTAQSLPETPSASAPHAAAAFRSSSSGQRSIFPPPLASCDWCRQACRPLRTAGRPSWLPWPTDRLPAKHTNAAYAHNRQAAWGASVQRFGQTLQRGVLECYSTRDGRRLRPTCYLLKTS